MTMKISDATSRESASIDADHELRYAEEKISTGGSSEMENDSENSSEETESPRTVWRWRRNKKDELVHSQILKIREEDSHLGEDVIGESDLMLIGVKEKLFKVNAPIPSSLDAIFFSRPILPCSPLGNKTSSLRAHH